VCYRCHKPSVCCICDRIVVALHRTPIVILQHPRERHHPLGTARIARLGLERAHVVVGAGHDAMHFDTELPDGAALLFPGPSAQDLAALPTQARPRALVVVDGTWPNARKIVRTAPQLQALPRVTLRPKRPGNYRIRRARRPDVQLSTIEAIVAALRVLEPEAVDVPGLLRVFDAMIDRHIELSYGTMRPRFIANHGVQKQKGARRGR
jgi:hypothetical protein